MLRTLMVLFALAFLGPTKLAAQFIDMTADERLAWIHDQANTYEVRSEDHDEFHREKPVLRFNDNVSGVVDAVLFVWTFNGRPEAAASFWYRKDGLQAHEFVSLSRSTLVGEVNEQVVWDPVEPGLAFKPLPGAPEPAETQVRRMTQMRRLASRFAAAVERTSGDLQLRLLPQPMIRYEPTDADVVDGAVFSFAKGTNPEVLVVIEAVKASDGEFRYEYSPARMTSAACELTLDGEEIWTVLRDRGYARKGTYRNFYKR